MTALDMRAFWGSIEDAWRRTVGDGADPRAALLVPPRSEGGAAADREDSGGDEEEDEADDGGNDDDDDLDDEEDRDADVHPYTQSPETQAALAAYHAIDALTPRFLAHLRAYLSSLPQRDLDAWDAHCARALFELDREEVHAVLDGSDDGFLYARGFVLAMGERYWGAVNANPAYGVPDAECESMCYVAAHIHEDRFGEWTSTSVSRESFSNAAGWPRG